VQVGEALDVKHVNFIDEEDTRNQLGNALVNVLVHNLVNLLPQFVCTSTPYFPTLTSIWNQVLASRDGQWEPRPSHQ